MGKTAKGKTTTYSLKDQVGCGKGSGGEKLPLEIILEVEVSVVQTLEQQKDFLVLKRDEAWEEVNEIVKRCASTLNLDSVTMMKQQVKEYKVALLDADQLMVAATRYADQAQVIFPACSNQLI